MDRAEHRLKVLVVDDHHSCRQTTARLLKALGYQPLEAADQFQAESMLDRHPDIAALVVDLHLDPTGDMGFARRLPVEHPGLPVLFASGDCRDTCEALGLTGADRRFLEKPFALSQLEAALDELLSGTHLCHGAPHASAA